MPLRSWSRIFRTSACLHSVLKRRLTKAGCAGLRVVVNRNVSSKPTGLFRWCWRAPDAAVLRAGRRLWRGRRPGPRLALRDPFCKLATHHEVRRRETRQATARDSKGRAPKGQIERPVSP